MKDEPYGLQPAEVRVDRFHEPDWAEATEDEVQQSDASAPVVEPEPTPETHPELFVTVQRPGVVQITEPDGPEFGRPDIVRNVLSGRVEEYVRRRREEDGDAAVVHEPPYYPAIPERVYTPSGRTRPFYPDEPDDTARPGGAQVFFDRLTRRT